MAARRPNRSSTASVPNGADGITLATIASPRTLGKTHSEKCRVTCDAVGARGTLLATASRAAPVGIVEVDEEEPGRRRTGCPDSGEVGRERTAVRADGRPG